MICFDLRSGTQGAGVEIDDRVVVVYTASTWIEAIVVRGLLESAGIPSPALGDGNPSDPFRSR